MSGLAALKVLVVDDNHHMRAILIAMLRGVGIHQLQEAANGADALKILKHWAADVAFVDFQMGPVDGVALTRTLRTDPSSPNPYLPIIMMTGYAERPRVEEARDAGVTEFLVKPITARAIMSRLNAVVFKPRPFVRTDVYFGPTRRRIESPEGGQLNRRASDRSKKDSLEI